MNTKDPLIRGIGQVKCGGGSSKTKNNHYKEATIFVQDLRGAGFGVKHWKNVNNKHVTEVINVWLARDLSASTIKEYLSGVRSIARAWGNTKIAKDNKSLGIPNRTYVTNENKSIDQATYERVTTALAHGSKDEQRLAAQIVLARELGLRHEESRKFCASRDILTDGRIYIQGGTKGGRDRIIHSPSERMLAAAQYAQDVAGKDRNLIPSFRSEKQWENHCYYLLAQHGITKDKAGNSMHGFRHGYAHERYQQITGFPTRCLFNSLQEFIKTAQAAAGDKWRQLDQDARAILKAELGHGPDRNDVVSQYLGSTSK